MGHSGSLPSSSSEAPGFSGDGPPSGGSDGKPLAVDTTGPLPTSATGSSALGNSGHRSSGLGSSGLGSPGLSSPVAPMLPLSPLHPTFEPSTYSEVKLLGRGACGAAFLMRRVSDGALCVCKHVSLASSAALKARSKSEHLEVTTEVSSTRSEAPPSPRPPRSPHHNPRPNPQTLTATLTAALTATLETMSHRAASSPDCARWPRLDCARSQVGILASLDHPHVVRYLHSVSKALVRRLKVLPFPSLHPRVRRTSPFRRSLPHTASRPAPQYPTSPTSPLPLAPSSRCRQWI